MVCVPVESVVVATLNAAVAFAWPEPSTVVPSYSVTVLPGSAVPSIFTAVKLVKPSPLVPLSVDGSSESWVGAAGAVRSSVTVNLLEAPLWFPAGSVIRAVML